MDNVPDRYRIEIGVEGLWSVPIDTGAYDDELAVMADYFRLSAGALASGSTTKYRVRDCSTGDIILPKNYEEDYKGAGVGYGFMVGVILFSLFSLTAVLSQDPRLIELASFSIGVAFVVFSFVVGGFIGGAIGRAKKGLL